MKHFLYFCGLMLVFAACGTKKAATSGKTNTQSDLAYIQTFHNAMRYKVKGQTNNAIQAFDSCLVMRPTDDAAAYGLSQCYLTDTGSSYIDLWGNRLVHVYSFRVRCFNL